MYPFNLKRAELTVFYRPVMVLCNGFFFDGRVNTVKKKCVKSHENGESEVTKTFFLRMVLKKKKERKKILCRISSTVP